MRRPEIEHRYLARLPLLEALKARLSAKVTAALDGVPHIDRITFRVKDPRSFADKAVEPRYSSAMEEIEDQVAGRVLVFFRSDLATVRRMLVAEFGPVEYVAKEPPSSAEFGYESDHLVFVIDEHLKPDGWYAHEYMPETFELQIRTLFMHAWAEPQHDLGYKGADLDRDTRKELASVAALAWGADRTLNEIAARLQN